MTEQKDEAMLNRYLEGDSEVSREYNKQEKLQPSVELDKLILDTAEDAIKNPQKKSKRSINRWLIPTSIAATLVLSFSLIQIKKPGMMYDTEQEIDVASLKPKPMKQVLEKKKERRIKQDFEAAFPSEEQLANKEVTVSTPVPTTTAMGVMMESSPKLARKRTVTPQLATTDAAVVLPKSQWLKKIRSLLKDNKLDEAKKEFKRFSDTYPEFVPDTVLRQQLGIQP